MSRKAFGQELAIMIGIIGLLLTSYTFYNINAGSKFSGEISDYFQSFMKKDALSNVNNQINLDAKRNIELATLQNAKYSGINDGQINAWICNSGIYTPSKQDVYDCVNKTANYYFYLTAHNITVPFSTSSLLDTPYLDLYGTKDEVIDFRVIGGKYRTLFENGTSYYGKIEFNSYLSSDRFWYLYRGFRDSIYDIKNRLGSSICGLVSSCGVPSTSQLDILGNSLVSILSSHFDNSVKCSYSIECVDTQTQKHVCEPKECRTWNNNKCYALANCGENKCMYDSADYNSDRLIRLSNNIVDYADAGSEDEEICVENSASECDQSVTCCDPCSSYCTPALLNKVAVLYILSCEDHKYVLKYQNNTEYLKFNVKVYYGLQRGGVCVQCGCNCPVVQKIDIGTNEQGGGGEEGIDAPPETPAGTGDSGSGATETIDIPPYLGGSSGSSSPPSAPEPLSSPPPPPPPAIG